MLTGKQKRFLRSKAHHLQPIFQVGKGGVNENMIKQIKDALEARELLKISILQNCDEDRETVAEEIVRGTDGELVQIIGRIIVVYKESRENKQIELPSKG
ncbi:ribosome assembly RNA-binding protein YhbY [Siminovitchia fortis]|uniref:Ribosome assembly RNA-binding protein YhbY n=1 Tax=Siminovitchia fortis TaxID=254758 RepID=A0A443J3X9_9BACI|nr:ribosome assembly RNA-binding protein YhbY [Siminovitchia fortis]RWR15184.1 ribosome assembly RNA-binding protein YhbY [Siminovitchia fortis]WHY82677.1 ribosome assembly RNA-binding protein YhbY [Siminovitchia fortis]